MVDYSKITPDVFERIVVEIVEDMTAAEIMGFPGVADLLREELNNEVLERWQEEQENDDGSCTVCGGSGGGLPPCVCTVCGGTGVRR